MDYPAPVWLLYVPLCTFAATAFLLAVVTIIWIEIRHEKRQIREFMVLARKSRCRYPSPDEDYRHELSVDCG